MPLSRRRRHSAPMWRGKWRSLALLAVLIISLLGVYLYLRHLGSSTASTSPRVPLSPAAVDAPKKQEVTPEGNRFGRQPIGSGVSLFGVVRTTRGAPVQDARVRWLVLEKKDKEIDPAWQVADWGREVRDHLEATTAPDGSFNFVSQPVESMVFGSVLVALHAGHLPGGIDLAPDSSAWPSPIEIVVAAAVPLSVEVRDPRGRPVSDASVFQVGCIQLPDPRDRGDGPIFARFLSDSASTNVAGRAELAAFPGEQVLWAQKDVLISLPWKGMTPDVPVVLTLGEAFTLEGTVSLPEWDLDYEGERRIIVSGQTGNLWKTLCRLRGVEEGRWGPLLVPLDRFTAFQARLEGSPIMPIEERFERPPAGSHRLVDFQAQKGVEFWLFVQDEAGEPIPHAKATCWTGDPDEGRGRQPVHAVGRADGYLNAWSFPPGPVYFRVSAKGYSTENGNGLTEDGAYEVTLKRCGRIVGRCTHDGRAVTDFEVLYWAAGVQRNHRSRSFFGRADGSFEIDDLSHGTWSIGAASAIHPSSAPTTCVIEEGKTITVELILPDAIPGVGRIVDAATGEPLAGALVQPYSSGGVERTFPWGTPFRCGPDGVFELEAFVTGKNYLTVEAEGHATREFSSIATGVEILEWGDLGLHKPQRLVIELTDLSALHGTQPDRFRTSLVGVVPFPERTFTADGSAAFDGVPPGDYKLFIDYPEDTWARLHVGLAPGEDWTFRFRPAGERRLRIHLESADGRALPPVLNALVSAQEARVFVVRGAPFHDGEVSFEGIRADRVAILILDDDSTVLANQDAAFGAEASLEVVVKLGDTPSRIRVVDRQGAPIAGAWVMARARDGGHIFGGHDTDSDGWAQLFGLPEDFVLLDVQHGIAGKRFGIPVDASLDPIEVVLEADCSLELRLLDGDHPLESVGTQIITDEGVILSTVSDTDPQGIVRYQLLGEGQYRVACRRSDCWSAYFDRRLGAGEQARVDVQMRRLADLELNIQDRDGLPISSLPFDLCSIEFDASVADWLREGRLGAESGLSTNLLGTARVRGLPRGPYEWSVDLGDERVTGAFDLEPSEVNHRTIRLP